MPPPPKRPSVVRGGGDVENDPERNSRTQAKVRVPTVERGGARRGDDPERNSRTLAKVKVPTVERGGVARSDDPERNSRTMAREKLDLSAEEPSGYRTGSNYGPAGDEGEEASDYRTGSDYEPLPSDDPDAAGRSLDGDGLDALDPELEEGSRTRGMPSLEMEAADEDGEGEGDDENATRAGPPLQLEIVGGPDQGKKRRFKGVRMVIGRTSGVDFQLTDQSVSRRHIELVAGDAGVMLRDLGSGNGTRVNGEKVAERQLQHDDVIQIGKTKIRFVDEGAALKKLRETEDKKKQAAAAEEAGEDAAAKSGDGEAEQAEGGEGEEAKGEEAAGEGEGEEKAAAEPEGGEEAKAEGGEEGAGKTTARPALDRPRTARQRGDAPGNLLQRLKAMEPRKRILVLAGPTLVLLFLVLWAVTRPPAPPPLDVKKEEASRLMQQAREKVRAGQYEEAITLVESAEKLRPGSDETKLASQARSELAVQKALEEVKALIDQQRFDDARTALARAPQGSVKSEEDRRQLTKQLDEAQVAFTKERVDALLAAGDLEQAKVAAASLPDDARPEYDAKIADAEKALADAVAQDQRNAAVAAAAGKRARETKRAEDIALAFAVVTRKFSGNEWDRAASECDRVIDQNPGDDDIRKRAKALQQAIPTFGRNFDEGMKKYRAGQLIAAAKPLRKARELYLQIALPSKVGDLLNEALAEAAVAAGKEALLRDDLESAALYYRDAVRLNPDDPKAKQGLDEVVGKAEDLYQSAYMIRDRDPREALRKFKTVVQVTPPGSATHEKAKNQVAAMTP